MMSSDFCDGRSHTGMLREKGKEAEEGKAEEGGGLCLSPFYGSRAWVRHPEADPEGHRSSLRPGKFSTALTPLQSWSADDTPLSNSSGQGSYRAQGCARFCTSPLCGMWFGDGPWWSMRSPVLTCACVCFYVEPIGFCYSSGRTRMVPYEAAPIPLQVVPWSQCPKL